MKTLKFMLAAATAIGLASATYADPEKGASTGFEGMEVGTTIITGRADDGTMNGDSYFYYDGTNSEDNESVIAAAGDMTGVARPTRAANVAATRDKILQVSTGTEPLLRAFTSFSSGEPISSAFTADTYVDTLVQFTVTPYTDSVTPGSDDKLMIYLKETTNEVEGVTTYSTNLVVVAGYYSNEGTLSTKEYVVTGVNIEPNSWHRLTVRAIADVLLDDQDSNDVGSKCIGFVVYLDGSNVPCQFNSCTFDTADETSSTWFFTSKYFAELIEQSKLVLSLKGMVSGDSTLQAVGFAGEGKVDDLMITMLSPFDTTFVDFTLALGANVSSVSFTVNSVSDPSYTQAGPFVLHQGDVIAVTPVFATGYEAAAATIVGMTFANDVYTIDSNVSAASLTINAQKSQQQPTELAPGQQDATAYTTAADATAAAAKVTIVASSAVKAGLNNDVLLLAEYTARFETKVVEKDDSYYVEVGLKATEEAELQDQADDDAADVIEDLSESTVTLTTTPGFYYSFEYGTELDNMAEVGTRELATGNSLTLPRPTTANATAGFFKVLINIEPSAAPAQETPEQE